MIASAQDLYVLTPEDFDRLPEDGMFEVVDGRAILLPGNDIPHQKVGIACFEEFRRKLKRLGYGWIFPTVNVFIPRRRGDFGLQNRIPDYTVSRRDPGKRFEAGDPPELVIEILATRRGNVERTEKMDDYALAGILEYWIIDPFARIVEVYLLEDGEYRLQPSATVLRPVAFPGLEIEVSAIWEA